ncbi:MAG: DUF815 domain-containing protein [Clostridia bacterium]|nr:DUF815 domain-containing protein [Clostridia bacterium]
MKTISAKLSSLVIFRNLLQDPTVKALMELDSARDLGGTELINAYSAFASSLLARANGLPELIEQLLCKDENIYVDRLIANKETSNLDDLLDRELSLIGGLAGYDGSDLRELIGEDCLATWHSEPTDFVAIYRRRIERIPVDGYGVWAANKMFVLDDEGNVIPVEHPDPQTLDSLYGYEDERSKIVTNTEALIEGKPFNNVLLYGDAGTGKSSTVKAVANEFADRGLRLIELKKKQLYLIPGLIDALSGNPLKFIFFIDDLTFASDDRDFCTLKAILEGGISRPGNNIAIYVTSNHRHLIKESASDRTGDEISIADKLQEMVSLSARFGLTVTYQRPDRELYAEIVSGLAAEKGIELDEATLITRAEAFAIRHGGRNPRTAKQFVGLLASGII